MCFRTISLKSSETIRQIILIMERDPALRRDAFREVARHPRLQEVLVALLAKCPRTAQRKFIIELTSNARLRRKILKAAS
jgi:hypothetical protein